MSLIFATQLTAIATAALAVFAITTAWYARRAYRAQAAELGILLVDSKRQEDERRRAQAARVFTGVLRDPGRMVRPSRENTPATSPSTMPSSGILARAICLSCPSPKTSG